MVLESIRLLLIVVIGGLGSIGGTFLGALVVTVLPEALRDLQTVYMAVFGIGVVIILLLAPRGLGILADWVLAPFLPGYRDGPPVAVEQTTGISLGRDVDATVPATTRAVPAPAESPLLMVRNVTKHFGGVAALNDVSFDVREGEILGLIGPNGSGKSTMINVCSGIVQASAGQIELGGSVVSGRAGLGCSCARCVSDLPECPPLDLHDGAGKRHGASSGFAAQRDHRIDHRDEVALRQGGASPRGCPRGPEPDRHRGACRPDYE